MSGSVRIQNHSGSEDSARAYKWDVRIWPESGLNEDLLNLRCESTDVPNPTFSEIATEIRGFTKYESGGVEWNAISMNIVEVQSYAILKALYALGQKQFDYETGVQLSKKDYAGISRIELQNLNDEPVFNWSLFGCMITGFAPPAMASGKGEVVKYPFTIRYDYAKQS